MYIAFIVIVSVSSGLAPCLSTFIVNVLRKPLFKSDIRVIVISDKKLCARNPLLYISKRAYCSAYSYGASRITIYPTKDGQASIKRLFGCGTGGAGGGDGRP